MVDDDNGEIAINITQISLTRIIVTQSLTAITKISTPDVKPNSIRSSYIIRYKSV